MPSHGMNSHMNFRMSSKDKEIIETAAKLKGFKPNTYARMKLLESAEKDIADMSRFNTLVLSQKDWQQFVAIMEAPVQTNDNLKRAIREYNQT